MLALARALVIVLVLIRPLSLCSLLEAAAAVAPSAASSAAAVAPSAAATLEVRCGMGLGCLAEAPTSSRLSYMALRRLSTLLLARALGGGGVEEPVVEEPLGDSVLAGERRLACKA